MASSRTSHGHASIARPTRCLVMGTEHSGKPLRKDAAPDMILMTRLTEYPHFSSMADAPLEELLDTTTITGQNLSDDDRVYVNGTPLFLRWKMSGTLSLPFRRSDGAWITRGTWKAHRSIEMNMI